MKQALCAAILFLSLISCSKKEESIKKPIVPAYREYIIPKGEHYAAGSHFQVLNSRSLHFKVRFDSTCIYTSTLPENASDINKLYGFSDCGSNHQQNSARFGWLWNGRAIELYAYCYTEGVRNSQLLTQIDIGQELELSLIAEPGKYVFTVNGKSNDTMKRACSNEGDSAYTLFPYFGGDESAPHDIHIFIKEMASL